MALLKKLILQKRVDSFVKNVWKVLMIIDTEKIRQYLENNKKYNCATCVFANFCYGCVELCNGTSLSILEKDYAQNFREY